MLNLKCIDGHYIELYHITLHRHNIYNMHELIKCIALFLDKSIFQMRKFIVTI